MVTIKHTHERNLSESHHTEEAALVLARCSSHAARELVPYQLACKLRTLPLGVMRTPDGEVLAVACEQENFTDVRTGLRFRTGKMVKTIAVPKLQLERALAFAYQADGTLLEAHVSALRAVQPSNPSPQLTHMSDSEVPTFIRGLVEYAHAHRASDIHLTPSEGGTRVSIRVDGQLLERDGVVASLSQHEQLVRHLKVLARLDPTERQLPQDGRIDIGLGTDAPIVRLSVMPTVRGERVVLRLAGGTALRNLDQVGLSALAYLRAVMKKGEGAVLLSGSTGSGKTTTLYAAIQELRLQGLTVSSLEDPVEVELEGIAQTEISHTQGLDYITGLKSILRQDPDVIMVGELRDLESTKITLQAALSGHLVLSTVHAANVFHVVRRLQLLGIDAALLGDALELVISQRLVRKLCVRCRVTDLLRSQRCGFEAYQSVGCTHCFHQGFLGQVLVAEVLRFSDKTKHAVVSGARLEAEIQRLAERGDYISSHADLLRMARQGEIAAEELEQLASTHAATSA